MRTKASLVLGGLAFGLLCVAVDRLPAQKAGIVRRPPNNLNVVMPLNDQIVLNATKLKGQKIGRGECTDFVSEVLRTAKAKSMTNETWTIVENGKIKKVPSYSWGKHYVALGKNAKPIYAKAGNIIQFEGVVLKNGGSTWNFPHHTAIVKSANGRSVVLLHQNVDGDIAKSQVREQSVDLSWKVAGNYRIYTAVAE